MGRVSQDTLDKLHAFIASLPVEAKKKCALCNETLTHIVKQAEAQTGAGTRTVCRVLAESHNEGAASGDVVSESQLDDRVRHKERGKNISGNSRNNPPPTPDQRDQRQPGRRWTDSPASTFDEAKVKVLTKKYNEFIGEVRKARDGQWRDVPYVLACEMIGELNNYI